MARTELALPPVVREIAAVVGESHLLYRPEDVIVYETDGARDAGMPSVVVLPGSAEEVEEVVRIARRHGMPVIPRGAGTGLSGGAVALIGGVLIGTARLKRLVELNAD